MLGAGPLLWKHAHAKTYGWHTLGPPHSRDKVAEARAILPPRRDGIARMPASALYYRLIDQMTITNDLLMRWRDLGVRVIVGDASPTTGD